MDPATKEELESFVARRVTEAGADIECSWKGKISTKNTHDEMKLEGILSNHNSLQVNIINNRIVKTVELVFHWRFTSDILFHSVFSGIWLFTKRDIP